MILRQAVMVVDQFTPVYLFTPTLNFLENLQFFIEKMLTTSLIIIKLTIYIGNLLCNLLCWINLGVGVNRYTGVNWSTTTITNACVNADFNF